MKELSIEDQIYLCKYHDVDQNLYLTIKLSETEIEQTLNKLKANGLYEQYRKLDDAEYERIINREQKKDKFKKILDKYKFDITKKAYVELKEVLKRSSKYTNISELSIEKIYRSIADEKKVKSYIIANDCKRLLDSTFENNKEIFIENMYRKKPTVREFVIHELNIQDANKTEIAQEEIITRTDAPKESVISQITDIENTFVKVSVKSLMEYSYQKGYLDRMLEEEDDDKL